ncbi:phospholipase A1-Igamma2, chloroplastic-like [Vicia villosa]|uniref:phospholipase A1-Igamma2, chloroplastic-like n=1 Tax=Vicia villosa TaxID=3911 RepID=UPI00273B3094|nr:phospholipase A1-Igamma2, chloroplastic-like [Vicia villosa]
MATSISNILIAFPKTESTSFFGSNSNHLKSQPPNLQTLTPKKITTKCTATQQINTIPNLIKSKNTKLTSKLTELPIEKAWRKIHGEDDWEGLLDPMDPIIRSELIRYGELSQACYDAFDFDPYSKYCGSCKHHHEEFFPSLDLPHIKYNVTRYLYATANVNVPDFFKKSRWPDKYWSEHANWMGYIAVASDEETKRIGRRDIVIAWRGTVTNVEWVANLQNYLKPIYEHIPCPDNDVRAEAGFLEMYTDRQRKDGYCKYSAREQVLGEMRRLLEKYSNEEVSITVTGHSLGSAMATLCAYDIAETKINVREDGTKVHVSVFSFSGPRVGNIKFKWRLERSLGVKVLRVHNKHDLVPKSPGFLVNEKSPWWLLKVAEDVDIPWCYTHVGVDLELDHKISPFLIPDANAACAHNLEAHLHLLDGYHGKNREYEATTYRDIALVNKGCDFVKDEFSVPPKWRQELNRNMVKAENGKWILAQRPQVAETPNEDIDIGSYLTQMGINVPN